MAPKGPAIAQLAEDSGPYGKVSHWKSVGGDSLFAEELTLTHFYTEEQEPCDICYYLQSYALWNDYDYTYSVSKCATLSDTLVIKDIATAKVAYFMPVK